MIKYLLLLLLVTFAFINCDEKKEKEIVALTNAEDIAKVIRLNSKEIDVYIIALGEASRGDAARNEIINLLRRSDCKSLVDTLLPILEEKKETERFKSYIIQHLGVSLKEVSDKKSNENILNVLKKYMASNIDSLKGEAFLALLEVKDEDALKFLTECLKKGDDIVFLKLSIRYAYKLNKTECLELVRKYLKHENKVILMTAIYYLGQWKDKPSEVQINEYLNSNDPQIKEAAQLAIMTIKEQK